MSDQDTGAATTATETHEKKFEDLDPATMSATRLYELCIIFDPSEASRTWDKLSEWVTGILKDKHGAHVYRVDKWADSRRLAYEINGLKRGTYMVVWFRGKPSSIAEIDREIRLDERAARHIVVKHDFEPPTVGMTADEFEAATARDEPRRDRGDRGDRGDRRY